NTITKEKRYRESGITHKRGTGVMSVVMKAVTPSIKLEGTKASPIHLSLLMRVSPSLNRVGVAGDLVGAPAGASSSIEEESVVVVVVVVGAGERHSTTAEANTKTTKPTYPIDHMTP
ncbi:MAG: hypothetical protein M3248_08215, partial [Actinomycetota bacterium]|nr:hypothetical protein [Actinomycetota bacterium]